MVLVAVSVLSVVHAEEPFWWLMGTVGAPQAAEVAR